MQISEEVKKEEPVEKVEPEMKKEEVPTKASISEKILQEEMSEKRVIVERFLFSFLQYAFGAVCTDLKKCLYFRCGEFFN